MAIQTKSSRIDIRLLPHEKETLETAAMLKRVSLSAYILASAIQAARMDIEREETLLLNDEERDTLLSLLENPPEAPEALRRLFR